MANNLVQYDLLISCPGDIEEEIKLINDVVSQFNDLYSDVLGLSVRTKHWSKHSYAESGGKPQELLNKQFVKQCDAAIAIFWTRFGTPTDTHGSGTEEEIEIIINAGKQVFMYFSEKPKQPSKINHEQYEKIQAFKTKYKDKGVYFIYQSDEEFKKLFLAHLSLFFLSFKKNKKIPKLTIKSIIKDAFSSLIMPTQFIPKCQPNIDKLMNDIKSLFTKISSYNLEENTVINNTVINNAFLGMMHKPVKISNEKKKYITSFSEAVKAEISQNFFSLGSLSQDQIPSLVGGGSLIGTVEENNKYSDINKLYDMINDLLFWMSFEKQFKGFKCIKLAVINEGTTFDEDIDITLKFPKNTLIKHDVLPVIEEGTLSNLSEHESLSDIFGITTTVLYNNYESSKIDRSFHAISPSYVGIPFYAKDYESEYRDTMNDIFEYEYFQDADYMIIKLHVDYLKHNNAVAFPTVIFVKDNIEKLTFSISSKHSDILIDGELEACHP